MAKRGRPVTVGESGSVRVPKDIYGMLNWIADATRLSTTRVADAFLRRVVSALYLRLYPQIRQRWAAEDRAARLEGRPAVPLVDIVVEIPKVVPKLNENGWPVLDRRTGVMEKVLLDPKDFHPEGKHIFPVSELSDAAIDRLIELNALLPYEPGNPANSNLSFQDEISSLMIELYSPRLLESSRPNSQELPPEETQKPTQKPKKKRKEGK